MLCFPSSRVLLSGLTLGAVLMCTSCITPEDEPTIVSVSVSPNTVKKSATGMTDEYFTVTILTQGFDSELTSATVAIQDLDPPLEAQPLDPAVITNDTITLNRIPKSWFGGLPAGSYDIEATVKSDLTEIRLGSAATVTVTEN